MSGGVIHVIEPRGLIFNTDRSLAYSLFNIIGFGFFVLCLIALRRRYIHPLSNFPGPFWASITSLYQCWIFLTGNGHLVHRELHKKYGMLFLYVSLVFQFLMKGTTNEGPVVRYGPNALIVNDPMMLPTIYHRKADKTSVYAPNFGVSTVFTMQSHVDHVAARRRVAHAVSLQYQLSIMSLS